MSARSYHVVVWGATGFTGKLVCEHIAKEYQGKIKWALAGRNKAKLEAVRSELVTHNPSVADVDVLTADIGHAGSLNSLAASTDVVIAMAGPYARCGRPVVEACIRSGTHYCDITGEPQFIRKNIEDLHSAAVSSGCKIVHACGFDSLPSEMACLVAVDHLAQYGATVHRSEYLMMKSFGGVSGGTLESGISMMNEAPDVGAKVSHPYALDPSRWDKPLSDVPDKGMIVQPIYLPVSQTWSGPFVMAPINELVVRRSSALLGYGDTFKYVERCKASSWIAALGFSALMVVVGILIPTAAKFKLVRSLLPMPATGPSRQTMEKGFFHVSNHSEGITNAGVERLRVVCDFKEWELGATNGHLAMEREHGVALRPCTPGSPAPMLPEDMHRDPGYLSTSRMVLECALCLALQQDALRTDPYASKCPAGILTPAAAMGLVLVDRLKNAAYEVTATVTAHAAEGAVKKDT